MGPCWNLPGDFGAQERPDTTVLIQLPHSPSYDIPKVTQLGSWPKLSGSSLSITSPSFLTISLTNLRVWDEKNGPQFGPDAPRGTRHHHFTHQAAAVFMPSRLLWDDAHHPCHAHPKTAASFSIYINGFLYCFCQSMFLWSFSFEEIITTSSNEKKTSFDGKLNLWCKNELKSLQIKKSLRGNLRGG